MQYTDNYNLKLPQETDAVRVDDFNENSQIIDGALQGLEISAVTAAEIWGGNSVPTSPSIDGALSKLAQSVPSTMGTTGTVLTAGSGGASWGRNLQYPELIGAVAVNKTGTMSELCTSPTGWSTTNAAGLVIEGELTVTGAYNYSTSGGDVYGPLKLDQSIRLSESKIVFRASGTQDTTGTQKVRFFATFPFVCELERSLDSTEEHTISFSAGPLSSLTTTANYNNTEPLTVVNGVVTSSSAVGFYPDYYNSLSPYAASCTGTVRFYVLRNVS